MHIPNKVLFQVKSFTAMEDVNKWLYDNNDIVWSVKLMVSDGEGAITILYEAKGVR